MNPIQITALIRNTLIPAAAFMTAHGIAAGTWDGIVGFIAALALMGWGVVQHDTTQDMLLSVMRSGIGAVGGYFVQRGWTTSDQVMTWTSIAAIVVPNVWTWFVHADPSAVSGAKTNALAWLGLFVALVGGARVLATVVAMAFGLSACLSTPGTTSSGSSTASSAGSGVAGAAKVALADIQTVANALPSFCSDVAAGSAMTAAELAVIGAVTKLPAKTVANINNALSKGVVACEGTAVVLTPLATSPATPVVVTTAAGS